jgi:drug/metabolite transporter (DMT)-like permease
MNTGKGIALKLGSILCFTIMASMVKHALEFVPTGQAVFFRSLFAIPPIIIWALWNGKLAEAFHINDRMAHLSRGLFGVAAMAFGFMALGLLPLPEAIAIGYAAPILATALAALILRERVGLFRWGAVFVGMCGVLVILWPRLSVLTSGDLSDDQALGAWIALMGAGLVALATTYIRKMTRTETTLSIVFWFSVVSTIASLTTLPLGWVIPDLSITLLLILAGLLGGTAQIMMTESYRNADASTLAPLEYTSMVYGLAIGYLVFAEVPGLWVLLGASIVISAGILIIAREHKLGIDRAKARSVKNPQG